MQVAPWISAFLRSLIMGAPYGHTFTQVAQATQPSGSTLATWPANVELGARENGRGSAGHRLSVRDGLVDEARRVRQASQVLAFVGQIHRAQLGMRLKEEAVGRERGAHQAENTGLSAPGAMPVESTSQSG